jgi:glycine cleavage system H protein
MNIPKDLRYTGDHEWARVEGGVAVVGVTEFAVEQLGDITLVELPEAGTAVAAEKVIGTIESVKAVSDLFSPLTGEVVEINAALEDAPEKVNEDCYGEGWMLKIAVAEEAELKSLMDATAYEAHIAKS